MAALLTFSFVKRKFSCPCQIKNRPKAALGQKETARRGAVFGGEIMKKKNEEMNSRPCIHYGTPGK